MKNDDFDRLKKLCDENGFNLLNESDKDNDKFFVVTKKKDIWEGVEYVECILNSESYTVGKIYPIDRKFLPKIKTKHDDFLNSYNGQGLSYFKPSTEEAYIDQLKAKAFELYGEIKLGDKFDRSYLEFNDIKEIKTLNGFDGFIYYKGKDGMDFNGSCIYKNGQWAKKLPSKIKIDLDYRSVTHSRGNDPEYCELIFTFDSVIGVEKSRELYKVISEHIEK